MEHELLYEVDENDRIIGPRPRGELHRLGLRHRSVHILVFNSAGELFLQKRSCRKDISPGLWDTSAAGHVDFGEDYDVSAVRELGEELGLYPPLSLDRIGKLAATAITGWEFVQVYRLVTDAPIRLNADEIETGCWLSEVSVDEWIVRSSHELTRSFMQIWSLYRRVTLNQSS